MADRVLTPEEEKGFRLATSVGDDTCVHSAGVKAWNAIFATLDAARDEADCLRAERDLLRAEVKAWRAWDDRPFADAESMTDARFRDASGECVRLDAAVADARAAVDAAGALEG